MFVENKVDYGTGHKGIFWAEDSNTFKNELTNVFLPFMNPNKNDYGQVAKGITQTTMSNMWFASDIEGEYTLLRHPGLAIPDYFIGMSGMIRPLHSNATNEYKMRFIGKDALRMKHKGLPVPIDFISPNEIYLFLVMEDVDGMFFELHVISMLTGGTSVSGSGKLITSKPKLVENGKFLVDHPINGDLVFDRCECYFSYIDPITNKRVITTEYDTKGAYVNPMNNMEVILVNEQQELETDMDGRMGIVSYTL
jgi:hypothetical protein